MLPLPSMVLNAWSAPSKGLWDYEWGKDRVIPVLIMEAYTGSGGTAPLINFGTRCRSVVSFMCWLHYPKEKGPPDNSSLVTSLQSPSSWCNFTLSAIYLCLLYPHYPPIISNIYTEMGTDRGNAGLT